MKTVEMNEKKRTESEKRWWWWWNKKESIGLARRKQTFIKPKIQQEMVEYMCNILASLKVNKFS